jgi:hypothetical protein
VAVGAAALVMTLSVALAEGTFPGRNGQIVFEQLLDTGYQIAIMGPTGSNPHIGAQGRVTSPPPQLSWKKKCGSPLASRLKWTSPTPTARRLRGLRRGRRRPTP